ncbi:MULTISPECIES: type II toxin-antitoxin system YafQ family toxin [Mesorhizobium]|uniref:type II toxin-antitoxin system YafQ family toxin n=1 Tax=Mesorhizobium TaxID=68287 RepID=UPI0032AF4911
MEKRGKDLAKLRELLALLVAGQELPAIYKDHPLKGDWRAIVTRTWNRIGSDLPHCRR